MDSFKETSWIAGLRSRWSWEALPCTLALISGPLVNAVNGLTGSADTQGGDGRGAQALRGLLFFLMGVYLVRMRRVDILDHPLIRPVVLIAGYTVLMSPFSVHPFENVVFALKVGFLALVCGNVLCLAEQGVCGERWLSLCVWGVLLCIASGQVFGLVSGRATAVVVNEYATGGFTQQTAVTAALAVSTLPLLLLSFPHT